MENAQTPRVDGGSCLKGVDAAARCFAADETHALILDEIVETADGVGAAAHAGNDSVRQAAFLFQHLLLDFFGDDGLEVAHDGGERVRPHHRAKAVVGIADAAGPLAHGFGHGVLQGASAAGDGDDLGTQQAHPVDVQGLPFGVFLSHEHHALHAQQGGGGGGGDTVLACAGLGDKAGLAHLFGKQCLPEDVVDLMCAGVVQILALEVDLCAAEILGHLFGVVQAAGAACVFVEQLGEFAVELRVIFIMVVGFLQFDHGIHQRFGDVLSAVDAKASVWVRHGVSFLSSFVVFACCGHECRHLCGVLLPCRFNAGTHVHRIRVKPLYGVPYGIRVKPSGKEIKAAEFVQNGPVKSRAGAACAGVQQNEVCRAFLSICKACGICHAEGLNQRFVCQFSQALDVSFILLPVELGEVEDSIIQQARHRFWRFVHEHAHGLDLRRELCLQCGGYFPGNISLALGRKHKADVFRLQRICRRDILRAGQAAQFDPGHLTTALSIPAASRSCPGPA